MVIFGDVCFLCRCDTSDEIVVLAGRGQKILARSTPSDGQSASANDLRSRPGPRWTSDSADRPSSLAPVFNRKTRGLIDGLSKFFTPSPVGRRSRGEAEAEAEPDDFPKRYWPRSRGFRRRPRASPSSKMAADSPHALGPPPPPPPPALHGPAPGPGAPRPPSPLSWSGAASAGSFGGFPGRGQLKALFDGLSHIFSTQAQSRKKGLPSYAPPKRGRRPADLSVTVPRPRPQHPGPAPGGWGLPRGRPFKGAGRFRRTPLLRKLRALSRLKHRTPPHRAAPPPARGLDSAAGRARPEQRDGKHSASGS